jgi:hypothetical protein
VIRPKISFSEEPMPHLPIACSLSAHELKCGAAELLPGLAEAARAVRPLQDGVRLDFDAGQGVLARVAGVIERERQCCQFLRFRLEVAPGFGGISLEIDGPPGTSEFLSGLHSALAPPAAQQNVP